jgi:hypothetical protein
MKRYIAELIWNREFNWCTWHKEGFDTLESAKASLISIRDSGDGARVKKVRVIDTETDRVVWTG